MEYIPLLSNTGGVSRFDKSFSYDCFIPTGGIGASISDAEAAYVGNLITHAERREKIPVLTATRSLGRVAGLKAAAPGTHVILYRNIFRQWCSYSYQASKNNSYFIDRNNEIIDKSSHDKEIKNIKEIFSFENDRSALETSFCRFVLLHLYLYANSVAFVDFIFNVNLAATQKTHQQDFEDLIGQRGLSIDLSGTTDSILYSSLEASRSSELVDEIVLIAGGIIDAAPSPKGRRFASKALEDFVEEHNRYNHYTKFIRSVMIKTVENSDASKAELAEAERARDAFREAHDAAVIQREAAEQACQTAQAERVEAERLREELRQGYESALIQRDAAERARATEQASRLESERLREELRLTLEAALIQREAAEKAYEAERLEAERVGEELRQAQATVQAERDALERHPIRLDRRRRSLRPRDSCGTPPLRSA